MKIFKHIQKWRDEYHGPKDASHYDSTLNTFASFFLTVLQLFPSKSLPPCFRSASFLKYKHFCIHHEAIITSNKNHQGVSVLASKCCTFPRYLKVFTVGLDSGRNQVRIHDPHFKPLFICNRLLKNRSVFWQRLTLRSYLLASVGWCF